MILNKEEIGRSRAVIAKTPKHTQCCTCVFGLQDEGKYHCGYAAITGKTCKTERGGVIYDRRGCVAEDCRLYVKGRKKQNERGLWTERIEED